MALEVDHILDPEIIIPSSDTKNTLEFWSRALGWSKHSHFKIGPSTLRKLEELVSSPPEILGFPTRDFWTVINKFISRPLPDNEPVQVCDVHPTPHYVPYMGDPDNDRRLREVLRNAGTKVVALGTDSRAWSAPGPISCAKCELPITYHIENSTDGTVERLETSPAWRRAQVEAGISSLKDIASKADLLFPNLHFSHNCWQGITELTGETTALAKAVTSHLAVLNDHVVQVWNAEPTTVGRQGALRSFGVSASPESQATRKNSKAIRLRDFEFSHGVVRCEWHTKLNKTGNRIHFAVQENEAFIGAIVHHLPT